MGAAARLSDCSFAAEDGVHRNELWTSDGTEAGTFMVKDIQNENNPSLRNITDLTSFGGDLYFSANDGLSGQELWRSDGTEEGTILVGDINPSGDSRPTWMTVHESSLFFSANDGTHGTELWKLDSSLSPVLVKDINGPNSPSSSSPSYLTSFDGHLYFSATNASNGTELWVTDGTETGTQLAVDVRIGFRGSLPEAISVVNLLTSDGTVQDRLIFAADNGTTGAELWQSDGTQGGTILIRDILAGTGDSNPSDLIASGGKLFFSASVQSPPEHRELWVSDGSTDGTLLLKDLNNGSSSDPFRFTDANGNLFFVANGTNSSGSFRYGQELYVSDGTRDGTHLVKDINTQPSTYGSSSSVPNNLTAVGARVFFTADDQAGGILNRELWVSDGTEEGTYLVKDFNPIGSSNVGEMVDVDGTLFFSVSVDGLGIEMWKSDGTESGTVLVKDIFPGATSSIPRGLTAVKQIDAQGIVTTELYFFARDPNETSNVYQLWKSDGTEAGTIPLSSFTSANWPFDNRADVNGTFFFTSGSKTRFGSRMELQKGRFKSKTSPRPSYHHSCVGSR